jgi:ABC-type Fe3+-siderophore transport system permease subunit
MIYIAGVLIAALALLKTPLGSSMVAIVIGAILGITFTVHVVSEAVAGHVDPIGGLFCGIAVLAIAMAVVDGLYRVSVRQRRT